MKFTKYTAVIAFLRHFWVNSFLSNHCTIIENTNISVWLHSSPILICILSNSFSTPSHPFFRFSLIFILKTSFYLLLLSEISYLTNWPSAINSLSRTFDYLSERYFRCFYIWRENHWIVLYIFIYSLILCSVSLSPFLPLLLPCPSTYLANQVAFHSHRISQNRPSPRTVYNDVCNIIHYQLYILFHLPFRW